MSFERIEEKNVKKDHRDSFSYNYVKNEGEACKKIMSDERNNDCTTGNLLDFAFFKKKYRLIAFK